MRLKAQPHTPPQPAAPAWWHAQPSPPPPLTTTTHPTTPQQAASARWHHMTSYGLPRSSSATAGADRCGRPQASRAHPHPKRAATQQAGLAGGTPCPGCCSAPGTQGPAGWPRYLQGAQPQPRPHSSHHLSASSVAGRNRTYELWSLHCGCSNGCARPASDGDRRAASPVRAADCKAPGVKEASNHAPRTRTTDFMGGRGLGPPPPPPPQHGAREQHSRPSQAHPEGPLEVRQLRSLDCGSVAG